VREDGPSLREAATEALQAELIATLVGTQWENVNARDSELETLIEEGKEAAERSGDPGLEARLLHAQARYVLGNLDVDAAISTFSRARELARTADDAVSELAVTIDLGNTLAIHGVQAGLKVLNEALDVYRSKVATSDELNPELYRLHCRLLAFIGIGQFDSGNLREAERLLDESIQGLEAIRRPDDLPRILNYRAQAALAMGEFDKAESSVRAALELRTTSGGPWASYNTALLGKILMDSGQFEVSRDPIYTAWASAKLEWQVRLGTVVRQYLVEFLLRPGSSDEELQEAAGHVAAQITDAEVSGFQNMLAAAYSLAAELALRQKDHGEALRKSTAAVEILDAARDLPIVRTEEVLWRHSRCLRAAGEQGADAYWEKASEVLERKAHSVGDDEGARDRVLSANPVARSLSADRPL
jgi:tetratricopeptide (TPR) repeat protein